MTSLLSFVGAVETINDDWPALAAMFFGAEAGAETSAMLRDGTLHLRNEFSDEYAEAADLRFRINLTTPRVRQAQPPAAGADPALCQHRAELHAPKPGAAGRGIDTVGALQARRVALLTPNRHGLFLGDAFRDRG